MTDRTESMHTDQRDRSESVSGLRQARTERNWTLDEALRAFVVHSRKTPPG